MEKRELTARLRRIEGQVRGLQRMIEEERDCEAIITQFMAARAALDRVGISVISAYVEKCMAKDAESASKSISRVLKLVFPYYSSGMSLQEEKSGE